MPTHAESDQFLRDYKNLDPDEKRAFKDALRKFLEDLPSRRFRKGLRVKGVQGTNGIFEMTWADNGRATFEYGPPINEGEAHVIWRRVGTHAIFGSP